MSGKPAELDQFVKNLAGGGSRGVDVGEVAVAFVADVVIDIDPEFGGFHGGQRRAQARLAGGVQRDGDLEVHRLGGRLRDQSPSRGGSGIFRSMPSSFQR